MVIGSVRNCGRLVPGDVPDIQFWSLLRLSGHFLVRFRGRDPARLLRHHHHQPAPRQLHFLLPNRGALLLFEVRADSRSTVLGRNIIL